jgi:hypothetical protein
MPYCEHCKNFNEKIIETKLGLWLGYCKKFKIGRNIDSDICDKYEENNEIEKVIVHRADIKLERMNEHFE